MSKDIIKIACRYCNHSINIKVATEPSVEYRNFQEGFYGTPTPYDSTLDPKKDTKDWEFLYEHKDKKSYPGKKDVKPGYEDDVSPGTITGYTDGMLVYAYCHNCNNAVVSFNKKAVQPDPNYTDEGHFSPEDHFDNYPMNKNKPGQDKPGGMYGTDHNRTTSTPEVDTSEDAKIRRPAYENKSR